MKNKLTKICNEPGIYFQFFFRFDANAPYTASAIGITTQVARRPPNEWTLRNKNLANLYAGKYINAHCSLDTVKDFNFNFGIKTKVFNLFHT